MKFSSVVRIAGILLLLIIGAGAGWYFFARDDSPTPTTKPDAEESVEPDSPVDDPRLTFKTDFRNVRPEVAFVGDAACAGCHNEICKSYHAHPMGRSATFVETGPVIEKFDAAAKNPWSVSGYELRVGQPPNSAEHTIQARAPDGTFLPAYQMNANLALGSGTRGRSYLSVESGSVWQSPISWFSHEQRWDISPGFDLGNGGRRAIIPSCLFCHVDRVEPVAGAINRYQVPLLPTQAWVGCERCHGPGELHARERAASKPPAKIDTSIVNPKHLPHGLQLSICEQCHLQGQERVARRGRRETDFRPGLPWDEFVRVFIRHSDIAEANRSVGQFEQLQSSKCKLPSGESLLCTSCHDPHFSPAAADRAKFFRGKCVDCHQKKPCTAPQPARQTKNDNCVACHMPKAGSSNIAHTSVTDHRILKIPAFLPASKGLQPGAVPLIPFRETSDTEFERDLGIALSRLAERLPAGTPTQQMMGRLARDRIGEALKIHPGDIEAWLSLSRVRAATGEPKERWSAAEQALKLAPDSEAALLQVCEAALAVDRFDRAEQASTKLIELSPRNVDHRLSRASVYSAKKNWPAAEADCREALKIHPVHPLARLVLAVALSNQGNKDAGRKEFDTAVALATQPKQRTAFRDWFQRQTN